MRRFHPRNFDVHLREVAQGALSALSIRILGTILGFAVSVLVARLLGAQGSGVYYLSLSVLTIASTVGRIGLDNTVVRFVSSHASVGEWPVVRRVYQAIIRTVIVSSIAVSACLFAGSHWLAGNLFEPYMEIPLILVSLAVTPFSLGLIQADALRGVRRVAASQWIKAVFMPFGTIVLLVPFAQRWQVNGMIAAYATASAITAAIAWLLWRRSIQSLTNGETSKLLPETYSTRQLFQSSWPLFGVAVTALILQQGATILLGITGSAEDVGIFNVAYRIADLLLFPLMAMTSIMAPKFAALHRQGMRTELAQLVRRSSLLLTMFVIPASAIIFASADWLMSLFGHEFAKGATVLRVLLLGVVVNVSTGAVGELLMMTGHEYPARNAIAIGAAALLLAGVCLIPYFNEIGAAIAVSIGYVVTNYLMVLMVWKYLHFYPFVRLK